MRESIKTIFDSDYEHYPKKCKTTNDLNMYQDPYFLNNTIHFVFKKINTLTLDHNIVENE